MLWWNVWFHVAWCELCLPFAGIILWMCPANERWCYIVTSSLIGWVHTQNYPCLCFHGASRCQSSTLAPGHLQQPYWSDIVMNCKSQILQILTSFLLFRLCLFTHYICITNNVDWPMRRNNCQVNRPFSQLFFFCRWAAEQCILAHKSEPIAGCIAIFHNHVCYIKHGAIITNLTMKSLGVCYWYFKMPWCRCV